jgi:tetratricopeptide (TPR) repeat protein
MHSQGIDGLLEAANAAHNAGQHDKAFELWREYREKCPGDPQGYLKAGVALRLSGRFDSADIVLRDGLERCKNCLSLAIEYAWTAHYQFNWDEALNRWETVWQWFPNHPAGIIGVGRVLIKLARLAEAEERLSTGVSNFPADIWVATTIAEVATAREDWKEALNRWNRVLLMKPDSESAISQRGVALWHVGESAEVTWAIPNVVQSAPEGAIVEIDRVNDAAARNLVMRYESLGENCELGLVQRHFEAEPLGLLRWTYCVVDTAIKLLEQRLSGFGELENLTLSRTSWKEYMIKEQKYGIAFHTFSTKDIADEAAFLRKHSSRLSWLAEKFLTDLTESNKRFILKLYHRVPDSQIHRIHSLLRQYSANNKLLCISVAADVSEGGTVVNVGNGLAYGKLSRKNPGAKSWDIPYDEWRSLLETADSF